MSPFSLLQLISFIFVMGGIFTSLILTISLFRNRQPMKIMNAVWILTGLWASFAAIPAYFRLGYRKDRMVIGIGNNGMNMDMNESRPQWHSVTLSTLHCGAGCVLADIIGEWFTYFIPVSIGGSVLIGNWLLDFILALIIGIYFQYFAIRQMEKISARKAFIKAAKADTLSLTAWQIGMYTWMANTHFVIFSGTPLTKTSWTFWFMMQLAMFVGFFTSYPMNILLIKAGIKKGM